MTDEIEERLAAIEGLVDAVRARPELVEDLKVNVADLRRLLETECWDAALWRELQRSLAEEEQKIADADQRAAP